MAHQAFVYDINDSKTIGEVLETQATRYADKTFIFWKDEEVSYADFNTRVNQVANALVEAGVKHGNKVAVLSTNCPEFIYVFFASAKLGSVVVPVNPMLKPEELQYALDNSDSVVLVAAEAFAPAINSIKANLPKLTKTWYIGKVENEASFSEMLTFPKTAPSSSVKPTDIMSIIYTSGTTGKPKGVMLSHGNYYHNSGQTAQHTQVESSFRMLCFLPLFHVNAQVASTLTALRCGASLVLLGGFSPKEFLPALSKYQVSCFSAVPTVFSILNTLPDAEKYDLSTLKYCVCGAAPMPVEVIKEFEKKYKAYILEGYGLSEGTCASTVNPLHNGPRKVGSIGIALPGQEIKILDAQDKEVAVGQIGEICVRGPNVMQGYYKNETATNETLKNGWLHTGDLGCVDEEKYVFITGRKKEMIIRGGENIYPKEIEEVLYRHPAILDAAIVGFPDKIWGEQVAAVLSLKPDATLTADEVIAYCKTHLADYKCPKIVKFVKEYPRTATGKIQKVKVVEQLVSGHL